MKLEVLISTHGQDGIKRLASEGVLPVLDGVGYLISWQLPHGLPPVLPEALIREDVRVVASNSRGVSNNRNNCLDHAKGPVCLLSDDDLTYYPEGLKYIIEAFESRPDMDFAMFEYSGPDNKIYPAAEYDIKKLAKNHYVTEFEVAFRLDAVRRSGVRFNTHFGVGNDDYQAGEGPLWVFGLIKRKLKGRFFPIKIVNHPGLTTGLDDGAVPGVLRSDGAYIAVAYRWTALPRLLLLGWRRGHRFGKSPLRCAGYAFQGYFRAVFRPASLGL